MLSKWIKTHTARDIPEGNWMNISKLSGTIPVEVINQIPSVMEVFSINTPLRLSHFLSQTAHESGNFRHTVENLNYSAQALRSVFGRHFPTAEIAEQYARNPERIANRAYANRMGNGDEASGDGWKYRGRGYIQLTGRFNYTAFNNFVQEDVVATPHLVATKYPMLSAGWFWQENRINYLCDRGSSFQDITAVTRRINGGTNGLDDRVSKFKVFFDILSN
jgi:putative chitinase